MVEDKYNKLEQVLIEDYHNQNLYSNLALFDELDKHNKTQEFKHLYNPLHVYCRFVQCYSFEKEWAMDYLLNYDAVYKLKK